MRRADSRILCEQTLVTSKLKAILFFAGIGSTALTVVEASITRTYSLVHGYLMLGGLLLSFVSGVNWLLHDFKSREPKSKMIRGTLCAAWILVFPIIFIIVGFMGEGLSNDWGTR